MKKSIFYTPFLILLLCSCEGPHREVDIKIKTVSSTDTVHYSGPYIELCLEQGDLKVQRKTNGYYTTLASNVVTYEILEKE